MNEFVSLGQKWTLGLIGLGALSLVLANPQSFYNATTGIRKIIGGSATEIITVGRS